MPKAIFRAPSHHELYLDPEGDPVYGGEEFTLPEGAPLPPNCELVGDASKSSDEEVTEIAEGDEESDS